ncbi:MAG: PIG-L family deacetylase [Thermoprotei archaeon]
MFSPHPDDVVYSAFSTITNTPNNKVVVTVFSVSRFTKWGLGSPKLVSALRKLEDRLVFTLLGVRSYYLDEPDTSILESKLFRVRPLVKIVSIYSPLGVGLHPNHVATRKIAFHLWYSLGRRPKLVLYEDLPYAARVGSYWELVERLAKEVGRLRMRYIPLRDDQLKLKLLFSRLYLTQTNVTDELRRRAAENGLCCGFRYAERFFDVEP